MSVTITLGKSRKTSKWEVLVQPEKPFGEHLAAYRAIAVKSPVSEEYSNVIIGKVNHSSPALVLITGKQAEEKAKVEADRLVLIKNLGKTADQRMEKINQENSNQKQEEHNEQIEEKNLAINKIRKASNQDEIGKPKDEVKK